MTLALARPATLGCGRGNEKDVRRAVKLHVHFETKDLRVNEVVEGDTAEATVSAMQKRVAQELGFMAGAVVRAMPPLAFAQEVTRRYNKAMNDNAPAPQSCEDFLRYGIQKGFATVVDGAGLPPDLSSGSASQ